MAFRISFLWLKKQVRHSRTEQHFKNNSFRGRAPSQLKHLSLVTGCVASPEGAIRPHSSRGHEFLRHSYQVKRVFIKPCFLVMWNNRSRLAITRNKLLWVQNAAVKLTLTMLTVTSLETLQSPHSKTLFLVMVSSDEALTRLLWKNDLTAEQIYYTPSVTLFTVPFQFCHLV